MRFSVFFCLVLILNFSFGVCQTSTDSGQSGYLTLQQYDQITAQLNNPVSVSGQCDEYRESWSPTAPNIISLRDGDQTLKIVYWNNNGTAVADDFSQKGTPVYVTGILQNYRGELQVRVDDNTKLSTAPLSEQARTAEAAPVNKNQPAAPVRKQQWVPFDDQQAVSSLETYGYALVYIRSSANPLCKKFENDFLLHPEAIKMISSDKMFFISTDALDGAKLAKEIDVTSCPALLVLRPKFRRSVFVYTQNTTGVQVAEFLSQL